MDDQRDFRYRWGLIGVVAMAILVGALAPFGGSPGVEWWKPVQMHGVRADNFISLSALAQGADVVVVGRVANLQAGRSFLADPVRGDKGVARFAEVNFLVEEVVSDRLGRVREGSTVSIEIFLPTEKAYGLLSAQLPTKSSLVFLRHKGTEAKSLGFEEAAIAAEDSYYRLVVREAVVTNDAGRADAMIDAEDDYLRALDGNSFDEVLSAVREAVD